MQPMRRHTHLSLLQIPHAAACPARYPLGALSARSWTAPAYAKLQHLHGMVLDSAELIIPHVCLLHWGGLRSSP